MLRFFLASPSSWAWDELNRGAIELDLDYRFMVVDGGFYAYPKDNDTRYILDTVVSNMDVIGYMEW